jgi:thiosulfate reductase cytochrome b subunit
MELCTMGDLAKIIIILGIVLIIAGMVMLAVQKSPFHGKLPGDIVVRKEHFTLYFPLATSIIVSVIISLVLYIIGKFR